MLSLRLSLDRLVEGTVEDSSGKRWSATCRGIKIIPDPEERFAGCAAFDGERSKITIPHIRCSQQFTFSVWVRRGSLLTFYFATILAFGEDSPFFGLHRGRPVLGNVLTLPDEIGRTWTHLAVTQDHKESRIYVDGEVLGSTISRSTVVGHGVGVGCDLTRGRSFFQGEMAQLQVFDGALSELGVRQAMSELHASGPRSMALSRRILPIPEAPSMAHVPPEPPRAPVFPGLPRAPVFPDLPRAPAHPDLPKPPLVPVPRDLPRAPVPIFDLRTTQPSPAAPPPSYAEHLAFLRALNTLFPADALAEIIDALESETEPLARSIGLAGTFTIAEGGSLLAEAGPYTLGAGGIELVELSGGGDGRSAEIQIDMTPPSGGQRGKVSARVRGKIRLFGGAVSAPVDADIHPDTGLMVSLAKGESQPFAEATVGLRTSRRCALSARFVFSHTLGIRGHDLDLPISTVLGATIDNDVLRQHLTYCLDLAGEEIRVIAAHDHPIESLAEIPDLFRKAALAEMEERLSEGLVRKGAAALRWLGQKHLETVERDLLDATGRILRSR